MKLQKNIIVSVLIFLILSVWGIVFFDSKNKIYDISCGVFASDLLVLLTAIIMYYYAKKKFVEKIYSNFSQIYFSLCYIHNNIGEFLIEKNLTDKNFSINHKLILEISNIMNKLVDEEFVTFCDFKLNEIIKKISNFTIKLYNLKNIIEKRTIDILKFEVTVNKNQNLIDDRENLLILIAKLHEYSCSLKIELDEILFELDKVCKFKNKWEYKKQYFKEQENLFEKNI